MNQQNILQRLLIYQKERFPLLVHIPLIAAFSFSAISFSRLCRGVSGFIPFNDYIFCVCTNLVLFFLLRVSDEHKDHEDDKLYRKYLPVIRGLVTLKELGFLAALLFIPIAAINLFFYPSLLILFIITLAYLVLMRYEFFVAQWLKSKQILYNASHMVIIPLVDMYASGYDWKLENSKAPLGLIFFFTVSFLNGFVLEIGRKIKVPSQEEAGVISYTKLWGTKKAGLIWLFILVANYSIAIFAASYAHLSSTVFVTLTTLLFLCAIPCLMFMNNASIKSAKGIEIMSLLWAVGMYLSLGALPSLFQNL